MRRIAKEEIADILLRIGFSSMRMHRTRNPSVRRLIPMSAPLTDNQIGGIDSNALQRALKRLVACLLLMTGAPWAYAQTIFNFTLARAGHTSAGVYNSSGNLVRSLWSDALWTSPGPFSSTWDNRDDYGNTVAAGAYTIKVLGHNVNYVWEGVVGNTSDASSGPTVHACLNFVTTLSFSGTTGCYSVGYSENSSCFYSFSMANPQQVTARFTGCSTGGNDYGWYYSDADNSQVFFACPVTELSGTTLMTQPGAVSKFNPVTGTSVAFTSGITIYDQYHSFTNGVHIGTQPSITGLAVQKNGGTLMAVSVAADNLIYLLDKTSGSVMRSFSVTLPGPLAMDNSDNLWAVSGTTVYQYSNLSGTPMITGTATGSGSTALVKPLALAVSPASASQPNLLLVADGGTSQQIKAYNMSGAWQWTFGQPNGYTNDPAVTTDKFWLYNPEGLGEQTAIAFQPDGKFWVVDAMNCRVLRYQLGALAKASPIYQDQIAFINRFYSNAVDQNNPSRVFASTEGKILEFGIDYTKTLSGTNGSWTLAKNWGHASFITSGTSYTGFTTAGFVSVSTLSNNRTYALMPDRTTSKQAVVELPASGQLRLTGTETSGTFLYADGSLRYQSRANNLNTFSNQTLLSFDNSGNPKWSGTTTIATAPGVTGTDPTYESNGGPRLPITSSNKLVFFDHTKNDGMHLGAINLSASNQWAWEAAPAVGSGMTTDPQVPFFGDGTYDNFSGIQYGGALHDAIGQNIIYEYKGEFWNASEANQLMHFYDDGLFVGQFGTPGSSAATGSTIPPGAAGNIMMGALTATNGNTYLYVNDENQHGGEHRWRLDGLTTIAELAGSGTLNSVITLTGIAPIGTSPTITSVPAAVTGLKALSGNGSVFLQWTANDAVYYQVRRATLPNNGFEIIATGFSMNAYTDPNAVNGSVYSYVVVPINGNGAGMATSPVGGMPSATSSIYEAENGTLVGASPQLDWSASGNHSVVNMNTGSITINNVNGGLTSGTFPIALRYRWKYGTWTSATLSVNGKPVTLPTWPIAVNYSDLMVNIPLNSGTNNTLVLAIGQGYGGPAIDKFTIYLPPVLTLPANITIQATSKSGAVVTFSGTANDPIDGSLTPAFTLPPGSTFPIGATTVSGSAINSGGVTSSGSFTITVQRTFAAFQDQQGLLNPDPMADPNHTGVCQLAAYAFGVNPLAPDRSQLPKVGMQNNFLQISYPRWKDAGDLTYVVEVSGDLQTWNSGPGYTQQISVTPIDATRDQVIEQDLISTSTVPRRFIRIRLTH